MELQKQCDFHGKNDGGALYSILAETLDIIETNTCNEKNMIKCQVFFGDFYLDLGQVVALWIVQNWS